MMNRFNPALTVALISLMALVGCNKGEEPTAQTSPAGSSVSQTAASPTPATIANTAATKTQFQGLQSVVTNTKAAVEAGNFTKAKGEFDKFEDSWSKVEDGVKAKSPKAYKEIEDKADEIKAGLKASAPNKPKLSTALGVLNKDVTSVAKP